MSNFLVTDGSFVTVEDDDSGIDTLQIMGVYDDATSYTLAWTTELGISTSASCRYYTDDGVNFVSNRLIVEGVIENVIGSDGRDFIQCHIFAT
ncbi:MAG: hypothetical protein H7245_02720 [Candidatus Saccharibacteria bacterium]|nr:hypothetical protein [Pseudorhodobacter sp.]